MRVRGFASLFVGLLVTVCNPALATTADRPLACRAGAELIVEEHHFENWQARNEMCVNAHGDFHGDVRLWTARDGVASITQYRNGRKHGYEWIFDPGGGLVGEFSYRDSQLHGLARAFHPNGLPRVLTPYRLGVRHGAEVFYDTYARVTEVRLYSRGAYVRQLYCGDGCVDASYAF